MGAQPQGRLRLALRLPLAGFLILLMLGGLELALGVVVLTLGVLAPALGLVALGVVELELALGVRALALAQGVLELVLVLGVLALVLELVLALKLLRATDEELADNPCRNRLNAWQRVTETCLRLVGIQSLARRNWSGRGFSANY